MRRLGRQRPRSRGQALVEFSLILVPFVFMLMGILDLGRAIYVNNAVSEAAREIARTTSVHPCASGVLPCTPGGSSDTTAVIGTQKTQVPGLSAAAASIVIACTDIGDTVITSRPCNRGDYIRVNVSVPFQILTLAFAMPNPITLGSVSHVQIP